MKEEIKEGMESLVHTTRGYAPGIVHARHKLSAAAGNEREHMHYGFEVKAWMTNAAPMVLFSVLAMVIAWNVAAAVIVTGDTGDGFFFLDYLGGEVDREEITLGSLHRTDKIAR